MFAHRFAHVRSTEGWQQNPHVPRTPPAMEAFQLHRNSWSIMFHYVSPPRRAQTKKQYCYNVRCEHISRCFKFNQFRWSSEHSVVDAFESLWLYELLSDSHLPSLKVAGLSVSLFTPVQACWKYACQKQESRDFEILQSEALVRSLHSSHILTSKPSKSKCPKKSAKWRRRYTEPNHVLQIQNGQSGKVTLRLGNLKGSADCMLLPGKQPLGLQVFQRFEISQKRLTWPKKCGRNANIYTLKTILRCHGGDWAKLTQQSYHNEYLANKKTPCFSNASR